MGWLARKAQEVLNVHKKRERDQNKCLALTENPKQAKKTIEQIEDLNTLKLWLEAGFSLEEYSTLEKRGMNMRTAYELMRMAKLLGN